MSEEVKPLPEVKGSTYLSITDIFVKPGRARKNFDEQKLIELMESVKKTSGPIQPLVVTKETIDGKEKTVLVAGERRFRASLMAGVQRVQVVYRDSLSSLEQRIFELEENVGRQDLDWSEKAFLMQEIHELHQKAHGAGGKGQKGEGWTIEQTAKLVGETKSGVATQIRMAQRAKERPDIFEAVKHLPLAAALQKFEQIETTERVEKLRAEGRIETFTNFLHGDCRTLIKAVPTESVDCGLMDAPFGIPKLDTSRGETQIYTSVLKPTDNLSPSEVVSLIHDLAPELFRVMKHGAHLWMFFGWDVFEETKVALEEAGFDVVKFPIIWHKKKTTAKFSGYEPSPCFEQLLLAHRGKRSKRLKETMKALLEFEPISETLRTHPFEKPSNLLEYLISQSTQVGEVILDCFAGSASTLRVAQQMGRSALGFELDNDHYNKGQENLNNDKKAEKGKK